MKISKLVLMGLVCLFLPIYGIASNSELDVIKIETIKKLYPEKNKREDSSIYALSTPSLKKVFDDDDTYRGDDLGFIDYVIEVQGQDSDDEKIAETIKYQVVEDGSVKVTFTSFDEVVLFYVLECDKQKCLIDDVLESVWEQKGDRLVKNNNKFVSFKNRIRSYLDEARKSK